MSAREYFGRCQALIGPSPSFIPLRTLNDPPLPSAPNNPSAPMPRVRAHEHQRGIMGGGCNVETRAEGRVGRLGGEGWLTIP